MGAGARVITRAINTMNDIQQSEQLSEKERREIKREEKRGAWEIAAQKRRFKKVIFWGLGGGIAVLAIGGMIWYAAARPPVPESDIVSRSGFHWHSELAIYVKGVKQELSPNIGIGAVHQPMHTHSEDAGQGAIHLEFQGVVKKEDIMLGKFFKNWGKDMRSFGANMKMTVNGQENTEYENYIMHDKDKIELYFD